MQEEFKHKSHSLNEKVKQVKKLLKNGLKSGDPLIVLLTRFIWSKIRNILKSFFPFLPLPTCEWDSLRDEYDASSSCDHLIEELPNRYAIVGSGGWHGVGGSVSKKLPNIDASLNTVDIQCSAHQWIAIKRRKTCENPIPQIMLNIQHKAKGEIFTHRAAESKIYAKSIITGDLHLSNEFGLEQRNMWPGKKDVQKFAAKKVLSQPDAKLDSSIYLGIFTQASDDKARATAQIDISHKGNIKARCLNCGSKQQVNSR